MAATTTKAPRGNRKGRSAPEAPEATEAPKATEATEAPKATEAPRATLAQAVEAILAATTEAATTKALATLAEAVQATPAMRRGRLAGEAITLAMAKGATPEALGTLAAAVQEVVTMAKGTATKATAPRLTEEEAQVMRTTLADLVAGAIGTMGAPEGADPTAAAAFRSAMAIKVAKAILATKVRGGGGGGGGAALARDYGPFIGQKVTLKGRPKVTATVAADGVTKVQGATCADGSLSKVARTILGQKAVRGPEAWVLADGRTIGEAALKA